MDSLLRDAQHTRNSPDSGVFKLIFSSADRLIQRIDTITFSLTKNKKSDRMICRFLNSHRSDGNYLAHRDAHNIPFVVRAFLAKTLLFVIDPDEFSLSLKTSL